MDSDKAQAFVPIERILAQLEESREAERRAADPDW
tara:strand:- start:386 stop:490 length:105 start_codon:yes stop_codon:yes gene_type:complete